MCRRFDSVSIHGFESRRVPASANTLLSFKAYIVGVHLLSRRESASRHTADWIIRNTLITVNHMVDCHPKVQCLPAKGEKRL